MSSRRIVIFNVILGNLLCFFGGFVVAANLEILLGTNGSYDASWFKVAVAIGISLCGGYLTHNAHIDESISKEDNK